MLFILGGTPVSFCDLLSFATGLTHVPAIGFDSIPSVTFKHAKDVGQGKPDDKILAKGNTCANQIVLPVDERHRRFVKFKDELEMAF